MLESPRRDELGGAAMILASASAIQLGAALATTTFDTISPLSAVGVSYAFAALVLLLIFPPRVAGWSRRRWRDVIALGLVAATASSFLFLALDHLPLGSAVTVQFLGPLALAIWTGRRRVVLVAAALALVGVALVSSATPSDDLVGIGFALVAAAGWALYMLASPRVGSHGEAGAGLAVAMCVTAVVCLPFSAAAAPELGSLELLAALAAVGVFARALPFRLELAALRRLAPAKAGVLFSVEPAIAALVGAVALGQGLAPSQVVGVLAVVLAGILVLRDVPEPG
ncbi:MAG: inner rane transporter RhtA [Solirubrobacterales bacterium]|nr:inner rane transporter RhtA [Solirubrobacterales bacterium]